MTDPDAPAWRWRWGFCCEGADTAAVGRLPLRPGKPLVHRRRNGAWGYTCTCRGHVSTRIQAKPDSTARYNCDDWAHALREAWAHVQYTHKTPAEYEVDALEAAYALPATERTRP